ncbi:MAG: hypothetical protein KGO49_06130 [Gammaproteobacteria bacterium]|nr:hypothetical protein [Gammaproteobacteria bacterium]
MIVDCHGKSAFVGTRVKLLSINPDITRGLPEDEVSDLNSMINDVFEITEIRDGRAFIEKIWELGNGSSNIHIIGVQPQDFEVI